MCGFLVVATSRVHADDSKKKTIGDLLNSVLVGEFVKKGEIIIQQVFSFFHAEGNHKTGNNEEHLHTIFAIIINVNEQFRKTETFCQWFGKMTKTNHHHRDASEQNQ